MATGSINPATTFTPGLLRTRSVAADGHWHETLSSLGATTCALPSGLPGDDGDVTAWAQWAAETPLDAVVVAAALDVEPERTLEAAWATVRAVAQAQWVATERPGAVLILGPRPSAAADEVTAVLRSACENMARTLSIEWARYGIRTTAILPGDVTTDEEVAGLLAFLASEAADYWSGCVVELGTAAPTARS